MNAPPKCRKCGISIHDARCRFDRVNPKGVIPAVWQCAPSCGTVQTQEQALLGAIDPTVQP